MKFFDVVVGYEIALWNSVDEVLAARGMVRLGHLHALRVLDAYGGQARVQEVSDDVGITVGAASKLVDRLERDGLAERRPNPANRRSSLVRLTPQGQRSLADGLAVAQEALDQAVGDEDVDQVVAVLERLRARLTSGAVARSAA